MTRKEDNDFKLADELAATIVQRLVSDPRAQKSLAANPIETLVSWGVSISDNTREHFKNSTLEDIYAEQFGISSERSQSEYGILPAVLVAVATRGTRPVTNTRSRSAVKSGTNTTVITTTATTTATATKTVFDVRSAVGLPLDDEELKSYQVSQDDLDVSRRVLRKFSESTSDSNIIELQEIIEAKNREIRELKEALSKAKGENGSK